LLGQRDHLGVGLDLGCITQDRSGIIDVTLLVQLAGGGSATVSRDRNDARARSYTASGARSRMHLKCPSGHSRLKHGLQAISMRAILAAADIGGV
jgi:hypothetical protein